MSDSNRGKGTKARLIIGLLAATTVCAGIIGYGLWEGAKYEWQAHDQRTEYAKYTEQKIAETCVGIANVEAIKCRYDTLDAQRENDSNQRDLVAQRQSALWAYIMGAAAVVGIAVSAVGVWLVKTTFDETRVANEIAKTGARAWVSVELIGFIPEGKYEIQNHGAAYKYQFKVMIKNHGPAPASDVRFVAEIFFPDESDYANSFCNEWKQRLSATKSSGGQVLFAQQDDVQAHNLAILASQVDNAPKTPGKTWIAPQIVGCVNYRTPHAEGVRQTRFVAFLSDQGAVIDTSVERWWMNVGLQEIAHIEAD
jgi:hypothetical protein